MQLAISRSRGSIPRTPVWDQTTALPDLRDDGGTTDRFVHHCLRGISVHWAGPLDGRTGSCIRCAGLEESSEALKSSCKNTGLANRVPTSVLRAGSARYWKQKKRYQQKISRLTLCRLLDVTLSTTPDAGNALAVVNELAWCECTVGWSSCVAIFTVASIDQPRCLRNNSLDTRGRLAGSTHSRE